MDPRATILTKMRQTGKEISTIFAGIITEHDKSQAATSLLALMHTSGGDERDHDVRMMILGALAVVGREALAPN